MKTAIVLSIVAQLLGFTLQAQKFELSMHAGTNLTFVPDFTNRISITNGGLLIPNLIALNNSVGAPFTGLSNSEATAKIGFLSELELGFKPGENTKLSLGLGINQMKYQYDNYVDFDDAAPVYLSALDQDYGKTNLLFLALKPLNFTLGMHKNKIKMQLGPTFDFLINSKQNNIVLHYTKVVGQDGITYDIIDKIHFDSTTELNKTLYGIYLRSGINIAKDLDIIVTGQYYFNTIYNNEMNNKTFDFFISESKPFQLQFGLGYTFLKFGKNIN